MLLRLRILALWGSATLLSALPAWAALMQVTLIGKVEYTPGSYPVGRAAIGKVSGVGAMSGVALVEIYEVK